MHSKTYQKIKKSVPTGIITLEDGVQWVKDNARKSFDETIELHIRLGVDYEKSDQIVRGQAVLPAGAVGTPDIVVFTDNAADVKAVLAAGAIQAGGDDLITEIEAKGSVKADVTIATPSMMPKVAKIAKVLGPKGLMPNPKTGTVSDQPAKVVEELLGGKISFRMDQLGNIHQAIGKASWDNDKIIANAKAMLEVVVASKPDSSKGEYLKTISLKSTMSPAIRITTS